MDGVSSGHKTFDRISEGHGGRAAAGGGRRGDAETWMPAAEDGDGRRMESKWAKWAFSHGSIARQDDVG